MTTTTRLRTEPSGVGAAHGVAPRFHAAVIASPGEGHLEARTLRGLGALSPALRSNFLEALANVPPGEGLWLLRAGSFGMAAPEPPPPSTTRRPVCALGAVLRGAPSWTEPWRRALAHTGGDLAHLPPSWWESLPVASVYVPAALAPEVASRLASGRSLGASLGSLKRARILRFYPLDVGHDPGLRVLQVVTSLQQGGAERVALDLHTAWQSRGLTAALAVVGRPARESLPVPEGVLDLSSLRVDPVAAAREAGRVARREGMDVAHAHLLSGEALRALASEVPTLATIHNAREGWPEGTLTLGDHPPRLLVACSLAVERELAVSLPGVPTRTAWNGIRAPARSPDEAREVRAARREALGLSPDTPLLVAVANPRPQKRLERLPAVLAALSQRGREAHALVVGDCRGRTLPARQAEADLAASVEAHGVGGRMHRVDSTSDVEGWLAAGDVLVTVSGWEGLSLAWLEARALGLPVVSTEVGGAREVAWGDSGVTLVPEDAGPEAFAEAVLGALSARPHARSTGAGRFTVEAMADRYESLYRGVARGFGAGRAVWLVTNNFSMGGAQSSARRLLAGLSARGVEVQAVTLQEHPERPTAGRAALVGAGVPVLAVPPPERCSPERAVARVLQAMESLPPRAVLFWNALAEHKVRLADALTGVPVVDVSPGEMFHASLGRYFANPTRSASVPIERPEDYGRRLRAVVVKHHGERAEAEALGAPVVVIPNGVPLPPRAARGNGDSALVLGSSVRISAQKKLGELVEALRRARPALPGCVLRLAGGVEHGQEAWAEALRRECEGLPVEWLGEVRDVEGFLSGLDVFALVAEPAGCPNASLEAMAMGLPVVITDVGGAREQVDHGVTGYVTPRGDPGALAEALVALGRAPEARRAMGAAGRERAARCFSVARMVDDYARLLGV